MPPWRPPGPPGPPWTAGTTAELAPVRTAGDELCDDCVGLLGRDRLGVDERLQILPQVSSHLTGIRRSDWVGFVGLLDESGGSRRRGVGCCTGQARHAEDESSGSAGEEATGQPDGQAPAL